MKLEQSFEVAAPVERVWQTLIDVEHVAPCLPGAAVTGRNEDGSYNGTFTIKIGPTTASYSGKLRMEKTDEAAHTATMQAQGSDKRGQGGAKATIVSRLTSAGEDSTRVEVDTDYHITGRLARFGRGGMIEDISERLLREFASRLQASLVPRQGGGSSGAGAGSDGGSAQDAEPAPPPTDAPAEEPPSAPVEESPSAPGEESPSASGAASPPTEMPPPSGQSEPAWHSTPPSPPRTSGSTPAASSEPIEGLSLMGSVMLERARRNPVPLLGLLGAVLVWLLVWRRR